MIAFPGGLPIVDEDGILIGAIGVSGDTFENDHLAAKAGLNVAGVCGVPNIIGGLNFPSPEITRAQSHNRRGS